MVVAVHEKVEHGFLRVFGYGIDVFQCYCDFDFSLFLFSRLLFLRRLFTFFFIRVFFYVLLAFLLSLSLAVLTFFLLHLPLDRSLRSLFQRFNLAYNLQLLIELCLADVVEHNAVTFQPVFEKMTHNAANLIKCEVNFLELLESLEEVDQFSDHSTGCAYDRFSAPCIDVGEGLLGNVLA